VKFPYKLCKYDHLTHLCSKIEETSRLLSHSPTVLTKLFPHNQQMASRTSNTKNASSGNQNPSAHEGSHLCVNMVKCQIDVATQSRDYGSSYTIFVQILVLPQKHPCISKSQNLCLVFRKEY
jgi:hypothetical protein